MNHVTNLDATGETSVPLCLSPPQQLYAHQSAALTPLQVVCVLQRVWQRVLHCVLPVCCSGTKVYVTVPL